jgi:hypothetical protein
MIKAESDRKLFIANALGFSGEANQRKFIDVFKTFTTKVICKFNQDVFKKRNSVFRRYTR